MRARKRKSEKFEKSAFLATERRNKFKIGSTPGQIDSIESFVNNSRSVWVYIVVSKIICYAIICPRSFFQ